MIGSIRGTLVETSDTHVVVETGGIGYIVHTVTSPAHLDSMESIHFWTHLVVRENALDLYGFSDQYTRTIFNHLISIPKIGPKSAQQILQKASVELITSCVQTGDAKRLAKHSGLGPKTAEKVVTALADSLPPTSDMAAVEPHTSSSLPNDVVDALVALGYSERDAYTATTELIESNPELKHNTTQAITKALQLLGRS